MTAVDLHPPLKRPIADCHGLDVAPLEAVAKFKKLLVEALQALGTAMLPDPHFAMPHAMDNEVHEVKK